MEWTSIKWIKLRILIISTFFVLFLGLILFRSYQLQIFENARVKNLARRQYQTTLPVQFKRGTIYDRNGNALALDVQVASVAIHPSEIEDKNQIVKELSAILKIPPVKISSKIREGRKFEWVARRLAFETGQKIKDLKLKGVSIVPEYRRFYPNKELAGAVLGSVGYDAKGLAGIELSMDSFLRAGSDEVIAEKDARGRFYTPVQSQDYYHDIHLTLDANLQYTAEKYLTETAKQYNPKSGFAIILNPQTGEVLAMANYPTFNPNVYWEYSMDNWKNHAVVDTYEPGSTFKAILAASALNSGKVNINDKFFCENGSYVIGKRVIHDHENYGSLSLAEIVKVSSNIGITKVALKTGKKVFYDTMFDLGFNQAVNLKLPGEQRGSVAPYQKWKDIDFSNMAFGQGLTVSGMQMAQAYATIANKGIRMKPYLVHRIVDSSGVTIIENMATVASQALKEDAAIVLKNALKGVVQPGGTGKLARLDEYTVAGKTGTAQKVNVQTKVYDEHDYVSSFIGFVPADNPEFMIYVVYDSPHPLHTGGAVAAPTFRKIAQDALAYAGVPPEHIKLALGREGDAEKKR